MSTPAPNHPPIVPGPILRGIEDLDHDDVFSERVYRLAEARVIFADYALLQHDFPQLRAAHLERLHPDLRALKSVEKEEAIAALLDRWLLRHTAFISRSQARQEVTNTPIRTTEEHVVAFRPLRYGRALVFSLRANAHRLPPQDPDLDADMPGGLLDVKGVGVAPHKTPRNDIGHANGLQTLAWSCREYIYQRIVEKLMHREGSSYQALPIYGLLDPGFDVLFDEHPPRAASMIARRAHRRPRYPQGMPVYGAPELDVELSIERLIRKYGLTSCQFSTSIDLLPLDDGMEARYSRSPVEMTVEEEAWLRDETRYQDEALHIEGINLQVTRAVQHDPARAQILDFGAFNARKRFEHPTATLAADRLLRLGEIIFPDDPRYVQPAYDLCLPDELARHPGPGEYFTFFDPLVKAYRNGECTGRQLKEEHLDAIVERVTACWI